MYHIAEIITAVAALGALVFTIVNSFKIKEVHLLINSRLTELLAVSKAASRAEGVLEGREEVIKDETKQ